MRFHEIRKFTVPGVEFAEAAPGTDPATGKPLGQKDSSNILDKITGIFKRKDDDKPVSQGAAALNPLKNMRVTQAFKGLTHNGVDLGAAVGTPVYAPEAGTVKQMKGFRAGLYIELTTATSVHKFMHLSQYSVADGAKVKAGAEIALTGNTGFSTGPHLHWEKWVDGRAVNPL